MIKIFVVVFLSGLICACSLQKASTSKALSLSINSNLIKFSEQGFLYEGKNSLRLEIYKLGQAFFTLNIGDKICLDKICYEKKAFNERFFKALHYEDLMGDILKFQPLYEGLNLSKNECGFKQTLQSKNYDIIYSVCDEMLEFKDLQNKILIKIRVYE